MQSGPLPTLFSVFHLLIPCRPIYVDYTVTTLGIHNLLFLLTLPANSVFITKIV
jgi:hypothetical protein